MTTARPSLRLPARTGVAAGITAAVLIFAVVAGVASATAAPGPLVFAESVSAVISGAVLLLGTKVPLGYALVAGMVASVNPCGFVLLPAYLGLYLGEDRKTIGTGRLAGRAAGVSLTVTASFVLLFGAAGLLASLAASALASALPWIGLAVGAGLVLLGGILAAGRELGSSFGPRAAQHFRGAALTRGVRGYAAYGLAYGLASLGCTLPVFLAVVGTSFQLHGIASATGQFILFGIGMGVVLTALTLTTALLGEGLLTRLRGLGRHTGWVSAVMLWLAGAYVIYYWLTTIRLL